MRDGWDKVINQIPAIYYYCNTSWTPMFVSFSVRVTSDHLPFHHFHTLPCGHPSMFRTSLMVSLLFGHVLWPPQTSRNISGLGIARLAIFGGNYLKLCSLRKFYFFTRNTMNPKVEPFPCLIPVVPHHARSDSDSVYCTPAERLRCAGSHRQCLDCALRDFVCVKLLCLDWSKRQNLPAHQLRSVLSKAFSSKSSGAIFTFAFHENGPSPPLFSSVPPPPPYHRRC